MRSGMRVMLFSVVACANAFALDMRYPIVDDTYLDSENADRNFGAAPTIRILIDGESGARARGLFRLPNEIAALNPAEVHRVIVALHASSDLTEGRDVFLYPLTRGFVEGSSSDDGCTWLTYDGTHSWTTEGGDYDPSFSVVAEKGVDHYFRWDITSWLTQPFARSNLLNYGAILIMDESLPPTGHTLCIWFDSSEGVSAEKPYVQVTLQVRTVFPITKDTYVDSRGASAYTNFGQSRTVRVLVNSDTSVTRGLIGLPEELLDYAPEDIFGARVHFYVWQDNTKTRDIILYPLTRAFVEGNGGAGTNATGATWYTYDGTNFWTTPGGDYDASNGVVGIKGPILDPNQNDRFFSWDVTSLLTNAVTRSNLMQNGAILIITGESEPPPTGSDRAPFTSSDDAGYPPEYRPHVEVALRRRDVRPRPVLATSGTFHVEVLNPMPHLVHRIERSFDLLSSNGWHLVGAVNGSDPDPSCTDPHFASWTNAYYRIVLEP